MLKNVLILIFLVICVTEATQLGPVSGLSIIGIQNGEIFTVSKKRPHPPRTAITLNVEFVSANPNVQSVEVSIYPEQGVPQLNMIFPTGKSVEISSDFRGLTLLIARTVAGPGIDYEAAAVYFFVNDEIPLPSRIPYNPCLNPCYNPCYNMYRDTCNIPRRRCRIHAAEGHNGEPAEEVF